MSVMLLMLFGIAGNLAARREGRVNAPAIWLSFLGIWIFLMFWETSARYFMNLLSVMLVAALIGLPHMERWVKRVCRKIRASWRAERQGY